MLLDITYRIKFPESGDVFQRACAIDFYDLLSKQSHGHARHGLDGQLQDFAFLLLNHNTIRQSL